MENMLEEMIAGYTRKVAEKKLEGAMSISEGKQPVSFSGLLLFVPCLMRGIPKGNTYPWKVSILGWSFQA
jgi:hypothetical protein